MEKDEEDEEEERLLLYDIFFGYVVVIIMGGRLSNLEPFKLMLSAADAMEVFVVDAGT